MSSGPIFGVPSEWERFVKEHPVVAQKLGPLHATITKVFIRQGVAQTNADSTIFFLGRLCAEDFSEILLMCGNGYGFGAMRLLRSMYERVVTLAYLAKHPTEVKDFLDYQMVVERKVLNQMKKAHGATEVEKSFGKQAMDQIENDFKKVRNRFTSGGRVQLTWTKKTMEELARAAGKEYEQLYLPCYVMTLLQAHPSVSSIMNRLQDSGGAISFDVNSGSGMVVWPLNLAHNLVLRTIRLQNDYFKLGLDKEVEERAQDYLDSWK